jgi:hypothetical protein
MTLRKSLLITYAWMLLAGSSLLSAESRGQISEVTITKCDGKSLASIYNSQATGLLLEAYGIKLRTGIWKCSVLRTRLLRKGSVFSFKLVSPDVDIENLFSLVVLDRAPRLWMVPIAVGMTEYHDVPDEIHNRAAFNSLIASNSLPQVNDDMWISLALLYMNMTGHEIHVGDWNARGHLIHGTSTSAAFFTKMSLNPTGSCQDARCTVTIADTSVTQETDSVVVWTLTFSKANGIELESVRREDRKLEEMP